MSMEPSDRCESWRAPCPVSHQHHHHDHHLTILCPHQHHHHRTILCPLHHHHHHHLITCHSHVSPALAPLPLQNYLNSGSKTVQNEAHDSGTLVLQEQECEGLEEGEVEEEDEEPIFVLTDEWREFFAKSEAKRKLEKKQAKKKQQKLN
ncbi:SKI/DACH domain-containing protein 1-like isoform X1 [Herrania umbratica]|uniref:SKI/DACH domain-containing protein 1-like isoform X1 n=1 Tax=Herrania umbratica TaxID=108875 RepID=A0A6J0ZG56_9ROSI|nr:SKI/DACH domain-containing protein 1-like isoform X1 [Herrania umbratica]